MSATLDLRAYQKYFLEWVNLWVQEGVEPFLDEAESIGWIAPKMPDQHPASEWPSASESETQDIVTKVSDAKGLWCQGGRVNSVLLITRLVFSEWKSPKRMVVGAPPNVHVQNKSYHNWRTHLRPFWSTCPHLNSIKFSLFTSSWVNPSISASRCMMHDDLQSRSVMIVLLGIFGW